MICSSNMQMIQTLGMFIKGMWQKIMDECHAPPYAGHMGIASYHPNFGNIFLLARNVERISISFSQSARLVRRSNMTGIRHLVFYCHSQCLKYSRKLQQWTLFLVYQGQEMGMMGYGLSLIDLVRKLISFQSGRLLHRYLNNDRDPRMTSLF